MNLNSRIYPFKNIDFISNKIRVNYDEEHQHIRFSTENRITIKDRCHNKAIKRKTNFKESIPGDVFYKNLCWLSDEQVFGMQPSSERTGMAIERNGRIIWYCMPGTNKGLETRKVLIEKTGWPKGKVLKGILQKGNNFNR